MSVQKKCVVEFFHLVSEQSKRAPDGIEYYAGWKNASKKEEFYHPKQVKPCGWGDISEEDFNLCIKLNSKSKKFPVEVKIVGSDRKGTHDLFKDYIYKFDRSGYSEEEMLLQIMDLEDKERRTFERLKNRFKKIKGKEEKFKREVIPEDVRVAVWRRDEGQCAKCRNRERLEYDHIIPVSKGGGNTVRNIELLCEQCNRSKSNHIE